MNQSRSIFKQLILFLLTLLLVVNQIMASSTEEEDGQVKNEITISQSKDALKKDLSTSERMKHFSNIAISSYKNTPDSTLAYVQKMAPLIDDVKEKEVLIFCDSILTVVTNSFISKGLLNHAELVAESILKISKKLENKKLEASIIQNLIRINGMQRDLGNAKTYAIKGIELLKELKDTLNYAGAIKNLGNIEHFQGNYPEATELFFEALDIYKKAKFKKGIAACYNSISLTVLATHDLKKSEEYLDNAFEIFKEIDNKSGIGDYYINKGNIKHKYYKKDSSITYLNEMLLYYEKAYDQFNTINNKVKSNMALGNMGSTYWKLGEYNKAIEALQEVINFKEKNASMASHSVYYSLGYCYIKTGDYDKAITNIENSIALTLKGKSKLGIEEYYLKLSEAYQKNGDIKNAFRTQKIAYQKLKDFVTNTNLKDVTELENKYKVVENEKKLIQQSLEIEQNNNALSNRTWGLFSLGGIATIFGMGMVFYIRRNQRINKFSESLERKNQFIQTLNKEINHRAKNHFQFISNLLRMQSRRLSDEDAVSALDDSERRIQAMSIVYNKLLAKNNNADNTVMLSDYILELAHNLEYTFQEKNLKIEHDIPNLELDAELAANLGILINELVTNAVKHAFNKQPNPLITINFKNYAKNYHLEVTDNGNGTPELINDKNSNSFGTQLIQIITEQLKGSLNISKTNDGLNFSFHFKK